MCVSDHMGLRGGGGGRKKYFFTKTIISHFRFSLLFYAISNMFRRKKILFGGRSRATELPCFLYKFKFKFKDLYSSVYKYSTLDGYNKI